MRDSHHPIFKENSTATGQTLSPDKILAKIVVYWPVFIVAAFIALLIAFLYLRYATPLYEVNAKILIKEDNQGGLANGALLEDLGMDGGGANVENEVEILQSRTLMQKVVEATGINVHYYSPGRVKTSEYYYKEIPYNLIPLQAQKITVPVSYKLNVTDDNTFILTGNKKEWKGRWGDTLNLPSGATAFVSHTYDANPAYFFKEYAITIKPFEKEAVSKVKALDVSPVNSKASIVELQIKDALPQRGEDIINALIQEYIYANVNDRNATMAATVDFIDNRLTLVTAELSGIEHSIEKFKSSRKLTDLTEQTKMLLDYSSDYNRQITEREVQLRVIESLEKYLNDETNKDKIVPSALLVQDESAMSAMDRYNELQMKRSTFLLTKTENNPVIKNLDLQLENIRDDMKRSLTTMKRGVEVSVSELKEHAGELESEIRQLPENERIFLEYSRQQHIKQELYLYLLKKREETAISKSSTIPNAKIVDPARSEQNPVAPRKGRVYLMALTLGFLMPGIWVFMREILNTKVMSKDDIRKHTSMSIISEIGRSDSEEQIVVKKDSKKAIAEQFRSLRTNVQFLTGEKQENVILLTSGVSGEGKSFISLNLAVALAQSNQRLVLLELDLRKPRISSNLGLQATKGFSTYIIGKADIHDIIYSSGIENQLDVIPSGTIPPNPSELLLSKRLSQLIGALKKEYDYIIIDSAPVGLVTDAQILSKHAELIMYVCRLGYTQKKQLESAEELIHTNKMPSMHLIVNDVESKIGGYGTYGADAYFEGDSKKKGMLAAINKLRKRN